MLTDQNKAKSIFLQAVDIASAAERQAYVQAECKEDEFLRREIEALLRHHERIGEFLESGVHGLPVTIAVPSMMEAPGTRIGPYKLHEQIGEGGFGVVFMAEQQEPIRRKVAVKIVKPGMDSRQVIARFEAERQALALMDHPNIAKVLDAGQTPSGRPYFVMELVKGLPITDFCDQSRFTAKERLGLFVDVCRAVQHAHQKAIIHRDIKPSNVLVTLQDGTPLVQVIDFGISKALGQQLTDKTLLTGFAQTLGTPVYMSPEQMALSKTDVDTCSDIYSLGVLLYELLTGTTPFEKERLHEASYDEMRRIIGEEEPPKPSTRLSTLEKGALSTVCEHRRADPRKLGEQVRGDLDWIVMKALEKDRNRRYESVSAMAADVQRYLHDEPVEACPPSRWYRVRKFAWRNRRLLTTAAVFALVLVSATAVSVWQAVRARDAERRALTEAAIAKAVNEFLQQDLLGQAGYASGARKFAGDPYLTVNEAVDRAAARIGQRFQDQPLVEAAIQMAIGSAYAQLLDHKLAMPHLERAFELRKVHLGLNHPDTLISMCELAGSYQWNGRCHDEIAPLQQVLETRKARLGPNHLDTLNVLDRLARAYRWAGQWDASTPLFEQLLEKRRAINGPAHPPIDTMHMLAINYGHVGRIGEAVALFDKILDHERATGAGTWPWRSFANVCRRTGKFKQSEDLLREALQREPIRSGTLESWQDKANVYTELALSLVLQQQYSEEAERLAQEALTISEKVPLLKARAHVPMSVLGAVLLGQERYADTEPLLVQSYVSFRQQEALLADNEKHSGRQIVEWLARLYEKTNQPEKAREWQERLLAGR